MKNMRRYILLLCTLCLGIVSCVKENVAGVDADGLATFRAVYADASTRTVLDGLTPMWTPADKISVFDGKNNMFGNSLSAPALTAEFKGKLEGQGKARENFIAASPYSESYTCSFVGSFVGGMVVPAEQTAVEGSYDPAAAPAVAFTNSTDLSFLNAYSLVKFTIVSDGVTEVSLVGNEGETLAGKMNVAKADPVRVTVTQAETKVTVKGEFRNGSTYYMATVPAVLKSGITITLRNSAGEPVESMKYTNQVSLQRSGMVDLGELSLDPKESVLPDDPGTGDEPAECVVYFVPGSNWLEAGARFAAYFFEDGQPETWVDLTDDSVEGVYRCEVPAGYTNMIFVRMNPASADNNWDNKWNQTADLKVPTGDNVCYVIEHGSWDAGYWTTYPPVISEPDPTPDPGTDPDSQVIYLNAGGSGLWDQASAWFEVWSWPNGGEGKWYTMTSDSSGFYQVSVPKANANIIFVRRGPGMTSGWDEGTHYWNKTDDLAIPAGKNCYTITGWGGTDGTWSTR